jgi:hypothetical protein
MRDNLYKAAELKAAGWSIDPKSKKLVNRGSCSISRFCSSTRLRARDTAVRHDPSVSASARARARSTGAVQERTDDFDFDVVIALAAVSLARQRAARHRTSAYADQPGNEHPS